jgi:hypothetical protein
MLTKNKATSDVRCPTLRRLGFGRLAIPMPTADAASDNVGRRTTLRPAAPLASPSPMKHRA